MGEIHQQLELVGLEGSLRTAKNSEERRALEAAHRVMSELSDEDIVYLHSGLAQTAFPHNKPKDDNKVWHRSSGNFHLMIDPGPIVDQNNETRRVGVPYGSRARLIMLHLQSEGRKSADVHLGNSISAWMRSLGLQVTGGARGTLAPFKEQLLRVGRARFTMQWTNKTAGQDARTIIKDQLLVKGLVLRPESDEIEWSDTIHLDQDFHLHLKEHAVPLDNRAIAYLKDHSLGLDLYALLAYRLPRLSPTKPIMLTWLSLYEQIGSDVQQVFHFGEKVRKAIVKVLHVYPEARVEVTRRGLMLHQSAPAVPRERKLYAVQTPDALPPK